MPRLWRRLLLLGLMGAVAGTVGWRGELRAASREEEEQEDAIIQDLDILEELEMLQMFEMLQEIEILSEVDPRLYPRSEREGGAR
jgi:hypothetical protein